MSEAAKRIGKVYLVGAGPGDPGLITIRGKQLLEKAQVVVYDYLANVKLLRFVSKDVKLIYVGKKGGGPHAHTQEEINRILVDHAKAGLLVVRLKGGDPFIFGRGGEEIEELVQDGVDFEVVPGVTSASAAATYAGIPITHRKYTASVAFVTGHEDPTKKNSNIAWDKLATAVGTLVFYMGIKNISNIVEKLVSNGRDPQTPVAVIRWASTPEQQSVVGTLSTIADVVQREGIRPPAVIVVGDVVGLRDTMNWFEKKPLFGKRIMVTRTREQASELVYSLENLGADCVECATISLEPPDSWQEIDLALESLDSFNWLLFTSINAIEYFFRRLFELDKDARDLHAIKIAVVGTATEVALNRYGLKADLVPDEFTGQGLASKLIAKGVDGAKFLLPRALKASSVLPDALMKAGAEVVIAPVYQNVRPQGKEEELREILKGGIDAITFTSSSTCSNFLFMLNAEDQDEVAEILAGIKIASIGPITSKTAEDNGLNIDIQPEKYTIPALVESVKDFFCHK